MSRCRRRGRQLVAGATINRHAAHSPLPVSVHLPLHDHLYTRVCLGSAIRVQFIRLHLLVKRATTCNRDDKDRQKKTVVFILEPPARNRKDERRPGQGTAQCTYAPGSVRHAREQCSVDVPAGTSNRQTHPEAARTAATAASSGAGARQGKPHLDALRIRLARQIKR